MTAGKDTVLSYFGLRTIGLGGSPKRPILNGKPTFFAGFLDQSWWPDGIYTAPTDAALESDLIAAKTFGFNMIRLHQKVNPERWYYHADRHGIFVFQDAVQKYGHATNKTVPLFVADLRAMINGRGNHPCIVQWTVFNERDCVRAFIEKPNDVKSMVDLVKELDPTRLVDTNSGGPANGLHVGDVNDIHSYPYPNVKGAAAEGEQYGMIGEFGGIGAFVPGKEWVPKRCHTYLKAESAADEAAKYIEMAKTIEAAVGMVSACVYTQLTDVELECDGLLNFDRTNKFDAQHTQDIATANRAIIAASDRLNEHAVYFV